MNDLIHADIAYTFRKIKAVIDEVTFENRTLAAIEQLIRIAEQQRRCDGLGCGG